MFFKCNCECKYGFFRRKPSGKEINHVDRTGTMET